MTPLPVRIGCGSWADPEYVGVLYPRGLPANERLGTYAQWFDRVEVNSTYYALPRRDVIVRWVEQTPPGFLFDLKLPRAFSDDPAAAANGELLGKLLGAAQPLRDAGRLGALLLTLAPSFTPSRHRLEELDEAAEKLSAVPLAVELRHRGWVEKETLGATLAYFRKRRLTWVALDLPRIESPKVLPPIDEVTNPELAYLRLHGRNAGYLKAKSATERHRHAYTSTELEEIAGRIRALAARAKRIHVSVNNHFQDFAPKAALALRRLLGQPVPAHLPPRGGAKGASDQQLPLFR